MKRFGAAIAATVGLAAFSAAQDAAVERVRATAPATALGETGSLKMLEEERGEVVDINAAPAAAPKFRVTVQMNVEHQSNAALSPAQHVDDWLLLPSLEVGWNTPLGHGFSLDLAVRADLAKYLRLDESTYWGSSATALLEYRARPQWPRLYVGGQGYRYDLIDPSREITRAGALLAGFDVSWAFHGGRTQLAAGYQFAKYWASPAAEDRLSHAVFITATRQLHGALYAQLAYSFQSTAFDRQNILDADGLHERNDRRQTASAALIYAFSNDAFLRLYATYMRNHSNNPFADYENFTGGIGSALTLRF